MDPPDKRRSLLDDDTTESQGRPLPREAATGETTSPVGTPLQPDELPFEHTLNVEPDPAMVNDPRRVVLPPATESDPTRNVLPERERLSAPRAGLPPLAPPPLQVSTGTSDPTVNVSPDLGVVNDPNRVLQARADAATAPTVNVVPDAALVNDYPNRVEQARVEAATAPTVNVVPDPALYNDPNRAGPSELPPEPPTVSGAPPTASPAAPPAPPDSGLLWVREEAPAPETVNVVPPGRAQLAVDSWKSTDPGAARDPTLRTDPDPTANVVPWDIEPPPPSDATMRLDLPAAAKVVPPPDSSSPSARTSVPLGGPMPPPVPSAPRAPAPRLSAPQPRMSAPQPRMSAPQPRMSAPQPRVSAPQPRMSAPRASPKALLEGVAPLPAALPAEQTAVSAPPERAPVVPLSLLANRGPGEHERTDAGKPPPEARPWVGDEPEDQTRVMGPVGSKQVRPPRLRDLLAIVAGFLVICAGMMLARGKDAANEDQGPLPPEKIQPPTGYEPPPAPRETLAYDAPAQGSHAPATASAVAPPSSGSSGGASSGGSSYAESRAVPSSAAAAPSTRLAVPRCSINVPAAIEPKALWVMDGKRRLLRLRATPKREAIQRVNLFISDASQAERAELVRTENAAVYFDVFLDPEDGAGPVKVVLSCECGLATAAVMATVDRKTLAVELKYTKLAPPEVVSAKARRRR